MGLKAIVMKHGETSVPKIVAFIEQDEFLVPKAGKRDGRMILSQMLTGKDIRGCECSSFQIPV